MDWIIIVLLIIIAWIISRGIDKIYDILEEIRDKLPDVYDPNDED